MEHDCRPVGASRPGDSRPAGTTMLESEAVAYLRERRATYFLADRGPSLPPGARARWRVTPGDPQGWQANMVGFVEAPEVLLPRVLDTAILWFAGFGADTWLEADEHNLLFRRPELVASHGFVPREDWDAMLCHTLE